MLKEGLEKKSTTKTIATHVSVSHLCVEQFITLGSTITQPLGCIAPKKVN